MAPLEGFRPLNFSNENNNEVKILGWEAKCDQNTAAILVLEAPNTIKHNECYGFALIIYDVSEASNRHTDLHSRKHVNSPLDHQI